jgi:hypothetical protein
MQINKIHTAQKAEESSSLKNQELLFLRRPEITVQNRFDLAIAGLGKSYRDCTIAVLKTRYKVSSTFIYNQSKILKHQAGVLFGVKEKNQLNHLEEVLKSIRFFLEGKLETKGALQGLSNFGNSLGLKYHSTNFISELLQVAGSLLNSTYSSDAPILVTFLCDEVYSGGDPILVTVEAQSMMVLDIRLVKGTFTGTNWEESFIKLQNQQVNSSRLIKDQGRQMSSAVKVLPSQTIIGADVFHVIPHRLGLFHCRLAKNVEVAKSKELDRANCFDKTKTYKTALKKEAEWEIAKFNTLQAIDQLEWFDEHYFKMINQLRPFTSKGVPRDKATAELIIQQSLEALALLAIPTLQKQLNHIEGVLASGQLLHYMDQTPSIYEDLLKILDAEPAWIWMLYWQWDKKTYQTHSPKVQLKAKSEALAAKQLLEEYYEASEKNGQTNQFETLRKQVFSSLDEIVQASSLVETFNSILKPFINSARGQVSQELLNLVKFYHNHRIFKRGKRQHSAPIELLTGIPLQKHWVDLLMDKIKKAFEKYQVVSLKQLHAILCPKKEPQKVQIKQLDVIESLPIAA